MINNFEKAVFDWLYPCPYFQSMYLAMADLTEGSLDGQVVIAPEIMGLTDTYTKRFTRKAGKKRYMMNVAQYNALTSLPNSTDNVTVLDMTKNLQAWVQEQIKKKNYPDIGYDILEIDTTGIMLSAVDDKGNSKVQFQILIDYYYKEVKA